MLGEEYILQAKFFKKIQYFFEIREINVDFVKGDNFFLYCILKCVKMLFLFLCIDQIYELYEKYV